MNRRYNIIILRSHLESHFYTMPFLFLFCKNDAAVSLIELACFRMCYFTAFI